MSAADKERCVSAKSTPWFHRGCVPRPYRALRAYVHWSRQYLGDVTWERQQVGKLGNATVSEERVGQLPGDVGELFPGSVVLSRPAPFFNSQAASDPKIGCHCARTRTKINEFAKFSVARRMDRYVWQNVSQIGPKTFSRLE